MHCRVVRPIIALRVGADKVDGFNPKRDYLPTTPTIMQFSHWNRIQQIDPPVDAQSYSIDLTFSAGALILGHVVGPDDSIITQIEALGMVHQNSFFEPLKDNTFTIHHYDPAVPRTLFFKAAGNSLVGHLRVEGTPPENLTVRLQPGVTVRGRLVETETDDEAVGYHIHCESSKLGEFRIDDTTTDNTGRFEITGLISGNIYEMDSSNVRRFSSLKNGFTIDLTEAKAGDVIELGDVTGKDANTKMK